MKRGTSRYDAAADHFFFSGWQRKGEWRRRLVVITGGFPRVRPPPPAAAAAAQLGALDGGPDGPCRFKKYQCGIHVFIIFGGVGKETGGAPTLHCIFFFWGGGKFDTFPIQTVRLHCRSVQNHPVLKKKKPFKRPLERFLPTSLIPCQFKEMPVPNVTVFFQPMLLSLRPVLPCQI